MNFRRLLNTLRACLFERLVYGQRRMPYRHRCRLSLELLEDRVVPSLGTYTLLEGPAAGTDSDIVAVSSAWSAASNASWLQTGSTGTGNGLATFTFDANTGATRTGTLTIAGLTLTVTQAGNNYVAANPVATLDSNIVNNPQGVAVDGAGNVYVADVRRSKRCAKRSCTFTVTRRRSRGWRQRAAWTSHPRSCLR